MANQGVYYPHIEIPIHYRLFQFDQIVLVHSMKDMWPVKKNQSALYFNIQKSKLPQKYAADLNCHLHHDDDF